MTEHNAIKVSDLPAQVSDRLLNFWNSQITANEKLTHYLQDHPDPVWGAELNEETRKASQQWRSDLDHFTFRLGIPNGYTDRLRFDQFRKTWTLKIPRESLYSLEWKIPSMYSPRLFQCRGCRGIFLVDSGIRVSSKNTPHGQVANGYQSWRSVCSDACQQISDERRTEANNAKRKERNAKRSEALASRQGRCRVCGELFTLKRVTGKTCSDRCKKALQRNPERYAIKEPAAEIKFPDDQVMAISDYVLRLSDAQMKMLLAKAKGALDEEQQQRYDGIKQQLSKYSSLAASRAEFEKCAAIWLVDHPEALNQEAVSR